MTTLRFMPGIVAAACASTLASAEFAAAQTYDTTPLETWGVNGTVTAIERRGFVIEMGSGPGQSDLAQLRTGPEATSYIHPRSQSGRVFIRVRALYASGIGPASSEIEVVVP